MRIIYTCIGVLAVVLALCVFFSLQRPLQTERPALGGEETPQKELSLPEYGIALSYPAEGYALVPEEANGDLLYGVTIYERAAYEEAQGGSAGELPPGLTLEIYRDTAGLPLREWITATPASLYGLHIDPAIAITRIGMNDLLRYQYDGLYRTDAYATAQDGYVYLFRNSWSDTKSDMEAVIGSARFSTPSLPAASADEASGGPDALQ